MRATTAVALAAFLAVAAVTAGHTLREANVPGRLDLPRYGMKDFRDGAYYPVVSLLEGHNPYDRPRHKEQYPVEFPFPLFAPVTLLLHLPFGFLPHAQAQVAHLGVNLALVPVFALVSLRIAGLVPSAATVWALATVLLLSRPGQMTVFLGQSAVYLMIAVYLALFLARTHRWLAALALAITIAKPTLGVPLALLMLCRGDTAVVIRGIGIAVALSAAVSTFLVRAAGGLVPFVMSLRENLMGWGGNVYVRVTESVCRVDTYLLVGRLFHGPLTMAQDVMLTAAIYTLAGITVWRLGRKGDDDSRLLAACVVCVTILTGAYHQTYDALVLTFPALLLLSRRWEAITATGPVVRWFLLGAIAIPALNFIASFGAVRMLGLTGTAWMAATSVNSVAVSACFLTFCAVGLRRAAPNGGPTANV